MNRDMLAEAIQGKTLVRIEAVSGKLARSYAGLNNGIVSFHEALPSRIAAVLVKGKRLFIQLENGGGVLSTLGMSGWWYPAPGLVTASQRESLVYVNGKPVKVGAVIEQAYAYTRVNLYTAEDGLSAVYTDARNFGNMRCYSAETLPAIHPFKELGLDVLNELPASYRDDPISTLDGWSELRNKPSAFLKKPIGAALLDQAFVCGIGNIYRAEILYIAKLHPSRPLGHLSETEWRGLCPIALDVLVSAYTTQGTGYHGAFLRKHFDWNVPDDFKYERHLCYGRKIDPKGLPISGLTVGGRTMWYCPERQVL